MKQIILLSLLATIPADALLVGSAPLPDRPNILFAIADDWSYGHAGVLGCAWVKTPTFDRIAQQGLLFTHAYTPTGKCTPSRSSIITGRNPWQLKAAANHYCFFPAEYKSVVEALGENDYITGMTGKGWGPGTAVDASGKTREMTGRAFEKHKLKPPTPAIYSGDYAANFADFLDATPAGKPWFFWYGGKEPHRSYEYGSGSTKGGKQPSDIDRVPAAWPDSDPVRQDMLDYAFEVEHFDRHLGLMIAELEKRGQLDNTLIIVTSDNGMPFPHSKGYAYDQSDHLPLAIMWKNGARQPGRVVYDYVSFIDFAPTFLEAAGLPVSKTGMAALTGRSLLEIVSSDQSGQVIPARDHVLIGKERTDIGRPNDEGYPIRGIVKGDMIYLHNFETGRWPGGNPETGYLDTDDSPTKTAVLATRNNEREKHFWELCFGMLPADQLFDVRQDPDCVTNLAEKVSFTALRDQLFAELRTQNDPRMAGQGHVFDAYPNASSNRGFHDKWLKDQTTTKRAPRTPAPVKQSAPN